MPQRQHRDKSNKNEQASHSKKPANQPNHADILQNHARNNNISPNNILPLQQTLGNQYILRQIDQQAESNSIQRGFASDLVFGSADERNDGAGVADLTIFDFVQAQEEVTIDSTDNVKLQGHWFQVDPTNLMQDDAVGKTVLFLSGSGGSAETYGREVAMQYLQRGANVLLANYRGFGDSKQEVTDRHGEVTEKDIDPTQQGVYEDSFSMFNWLSNVKGIAEEDVIVHGYSLGGAVAANLVAELAERGVTPSALVMHSAMPSTSEPAKDASEEMLSFLPKKWARGIGKKIGKMSKTDFTTDDKFARLAAIHPDFPVLFISGDFDDGDQLSDTHTGLSDRAQDAGLNNVTNIDAEGSHFENARHITNKADEFNAFLQTLTPDQIQDADAIIETM